MHRAVEQQQQAWAGVNSAITTKAAGVIASPHVYHVYYFVVSYGMPLARQWEFIKNFEMALAFSHAEAIAPHDIFHPHGL